MTLVVTGANGHLGQKLLTRLAGVRPLRAVVRSQRAGDSILALGLEEAAVDVRIADYGDRQAMAEALAGASAVVHLVGIIKETRSNSYQQAHEATCEVLAGVCHEAGVQRVVYLSILGSDPESANACLASKGRAEHQLLDGPVPAVILQVPMVLGEGDYATAALRARALKGVSVGLRTASREQPIYAGDVVEAIVAALDVPELSGGLALAGPESLSRAALTERAAGVLGRETRVISLPVGLGYLAAFLFERLLANPPVTVAMLEVLDHDDDIDPTLAAETLGISLTALDDTLRICIGNP